MSLMAGKELPTKLCLSSFTETYIFAFTPRPDTQFPIEIFDSPEVILSGSLENRLVEYLSRAPLGTGIFGHTTVVVMVLETLSIDLLEKWVADLDRTAAVDSKSLKGVSFEKTKNESLALPSTAADGKGDFTVFMPWGT